MTPETLKYYEERFSMMATIGWKDFIEDTKKITEVYDNLSAINSLEELHMRKGQLDILNWIVSLKDVSELTYEELSNEKDISV